jgi:hypothetical protein
MRRELQALVAIVADKAVASWERFTAPWRPTFHPVVPSFLKQQQIDLRVRDAMNAIEQHLQAREAFARTFPSDPKWNEACRLAGDQCLEARKKDPTDFRGAAEMPAMMDEADHRRNVVHATAGAMAGALLKLVERDDRIEIHQTFDDLDPDRHLRHLQRELDQTDRVRGG